MFNRKVRGTLVEIYSNHHQDLEVRDRDAELKAKTNSYVDEPRNTQPSEIQVGDQVLIRQDKKKKKKRTHTVSSNTASEQGQSNYNECGGGGHNPVTNPSMLTKSGCEQPQRKRRPGRICMM